ncbi:MAG: catalase [Gammaproteobacteria bacterium]|nr:catalase [Gammaproteobacteria bacterium]
MSQQSETDRLASELSQSVAAVMRAEARPDFIPRFNQPKTIACVNAEFRVHDDIPEQLRHGLFSQPATYPARLRFANATQWDDSKKDIRGFSIRVSNVQGPVLLGDPGYQDFILNSYPALFVATPEDFLAFSKARQNNQKLWFFLNPFDSHLKSLWTGLKARKKHFSPLDIRYWSTVPFCLGESSELVVKYSVIPCSDYTTNAPVNPGENQLRAALKSHLEKQRACFHFAVQIQTDPYSMPIEDASVIWDEVLSPFQTVATITIENQDFDTPHALQQCEQSHFNPWQCLAAHRPLGRMNEVRRQVYADAAEMRKTGKE